MAALEGDIGRYGVATWDAFRVPEGHERYLSLPEVTRRARAAADAAGSDATHLRAINFARSAPAVTAALVGTHSREHVAENLAVGTFDATFE